MFARKLLIVILAIVGAVAVVAGLLMYGNFLKTQVYDNSTVGVNAIIKPESVSADVELAEVETQCSECLDNQDNDGDGLIDIQDPGCVLPSATENGPVCGNNVREGGEFCDGADNTCPSGQCLSDCTACEEFGPQPGPDDNTCGDGTCDSGEDVYNCPTDCGSPPEEPTGPICGANGCEAGEDQNNCPGDCGTPFNAACGDGVCDAGLGEDSTTCSLDCYGGFCGDGICEPALREEEFSCPADCGGADGSVFGLRSPGDNVVICLAGKLPENPIRSYTFKSATTTKPVDVAFDKPSASKIVGRFCDDFFGGEVPPDCTYSAGSGCVEPNRLGLSPAYFGVVAERVRTSQWFVVSAGTETKDGVFVPYIFPRAWSGHDTITDVSLVSYWKLSDAAEKTVLDYVANKTGVNADQVRADLRTVAGKLEAAYREAEDITHSYTKWYVDIVNNPAPYFKDYDDNPQKYGVDPTKVQRVRGWHASSQEVTSAVNTAYGAIYRYYYFNEIQAFSKPLGSVRADTAFASACNNLRAAVQ